MKKQKSNILVFMSLTMLVFMSCDDKLGNNSSNDPIAEPLKEIAIEISQEKENYQFIESIYEDGNAEFLQGDYVQNVPQKVRSMRVAASQAGDTIRSADEIPVYTSEEINQKIYMDGTYRYLNLNTTPADSNAFNDLNVHKQPIEEIVTKTILMDGVAYLYNYKGDVIHTEDAGDVNYSAILDSIRSAMANETNNESSPQGVKALQARQLTKALKSAQSSGMRKLSQTSDEIVMEMDLGVSTESSPGISPALVNTRNVVNGITAIFVSPIGDIALNEIAGGIYHPDLIRDLQPNSEFFKRLEQRKINVPILTFASEEDRWQIARTAYCAKNYEKLAKDENINNDGRFDMIGYKVLNTTNNVIKTGGHVHSGFAVACGVGGFFNPSLWAAAAAHGVAAATWYSTSGYIDNGLDYDHAELVGATRTVIVTKEFKFLWKKWTEDIPIQVAEPHDGVVPVKSQQLLKSRGNNVIWANTSIKGVNHMEQRNHPNTKREFDAVLDGRSYRPDIFDKKR